MPRPRRAGILLIGAARPNGTRPKRARVRHALRRLFENCIPPRPQAPRAAPAPHRDAKVIMTMIAWMIILMITFPAIDHRTPRD